jgi:hypothetical protein
LKFEEDTDDFKLVDRLNEALQQLRKESERISFGKIDLNMSDISFSSNNNDKSEIKIPLKVLSKVKEITFSGQ